MSSPADQPPADELALARAELAMGQADAAARRLTALIAGAPGAMAAQP